MTTAKITQESGHNFTFSTGAKMKYRTKNAGNPLSHDAVDTNFELLRSAVNGLVDDLGSTLTSNDLASYATNASVTQQLANYALTSAIPEPYHSVNNVDGYLQVGDLPDVSGMLTISDLSSYITTQELTQTLENYATAPPTGETFVTNDGYNKANWDTAYGWGDHAEAGYLTSAPSTDLSNYYTKSEVYTKNEVSSLIPESADLSNYVQTTDLNSYVTSTQVSSEVTSALGNSSINALQDVQTAGTGHVPTDGQALVWNAQHDHWMPGTVATDTTGVPTFTYNAALKTLTINT